MAADTEPRSSEAANAAASEALFMNPSVAPVSSFLPVRSRDKAVTARV
jgi:hypothetical protein